MSSPSVIEIKELDPEIIPPLTNQINDSEYNGGSKIVVVGKPGCFAPGTEVMLYNGGIKKVEDVRVGDQLMGDDSRPRNVLELCHNYETMYKIKPYKGNSYTVNENHILSLKCTGYNNIPKGTVVDITVKDFLSKSKTYQQKFKWYKSSVEFPEQSLDLDPYLLGYWLGDGTSACAQITTADEEVVKVFNQKLQELDLFLTKSVAKFRYQIRQKEIGILTNHFLNILRESDLLHNKHIPDKYKFNSRQKRLELLAGILDADGFYDIRGHGYDIIQKSERLLDDIVFIARSLGLSAYKKECTKRCMNAENHVGKYYRCYISGEVDQIPCNIDRKQAQSRVRQKDVLVSSFSVEKLSKGEYYGFVLDGNHRFLGGDFSVLHNTGKSTLIKGLLYSKKHVFPVGIAMSGSEDTNHAFAEIMPSTFVYNEYDEEKIKDFVKRQKLAREHLPNPWAFMVIDDCTDDPKVFNKPLQNALYKKGRHWKMMYLLSLQYAMDIKPQIRTNIDGIFILREPIESNRYKLYHNYASIIPTYELFCDLMDQLTEDYHALYIHNATKSNLWQDCVFYWRAPIIPQGWKIGCPEYWDFHYQRYNQEYVDPIIF